MSISLKMLLFFAVASFTAWPLLFAGLGTRREARQRSETERERTTGVIVDYVLKSVRTGKSGRQTFWTPVVEFTAEGQTYRLEYKNIMNREKFPAGTRVEVLYDAGDPARFHLEADPVFISPGSGAIKVAVIWIILSAVLAVALAVFVGGARLNDLKLFSGRRR